MSVTKRTVCTTSGILLFKMAPKKKRKISKADRCQLQVEKGEKAPSLEELGLEAVKALILRQTGERNRTSLARERV